MVGRSTRAYRSLSSQEPIRRLHFITKAIAGEESRGETTLYVRKRCDEPLQEIACQREEVDGVVMN